jgi:hypothetical protein
VSFPPGPLCRRSIGVTESVPGPIEGLRAMRCVRRRRRGHRFPVLRTTRPLPHRHPWARSLWARQVNFSRTALRGGGRTSRSRSARLRTPIHRSACSGSPGYIARHMRRRGRSRCSFGKRCERILLGTMPALNPHASQSGRVQAGSLDTSEAQVLVMVSVRRAPRFRLARAWLGPRSRPRVDSHGSPRER